MTLKSLFKGQGGEEGKMILYRWMLRNVDGGRIRDSPFIIITVLTEQVPIGGQEHWVKDLGSCRAKQLSNVSSSQVPNHSGEKMKRKLADTTLTNTKACDSETSWWDHLGRTPHCLHSVPATRTRGSLAGVSRVTSRAHREYRQAPPTETGRTKPVWLSILTNFPGDSDACPA